MAIIKLIKSYEEEQLRLLNLEYKGLEWCELGDQLFETTPAKKIYEAQGVSHTSIDLNGRNGALPLDLSFDITETLKKKFDVITNYGTTEHVSDQYEVFRNVHNLCKVGGVMIHGVPLLKNWKSHCQYYYSVGFFEELASKCKYEIRDLQVLDRSYYLFPKNLVIATFVRKAKTPFITRKSFESIEGLYNSGNTKRTQNYTI